jgi:N-acetyl sugar amidotransferase
MTFPAAGSATRICNVCVMDQSDPHIQFDQAGQCNHCRRADGLLALLPQDDDEARRRLAAIGDKIRRRRGSRHQYDAVVGLSGGVDSSYVALLAKRLDLDVLAVHFDNGWNSETSVSNIEKLCETLGFDLVTFVIDWEEFRDLQRSFLLAGVIDVELVTDHAIFAAMLDLAKQHHLRHVLSGMNLATEAILPAAWVWPKQDLRNIRAIHDRFGTRELRTYPTCGAARWALMRYTPLGPTYFEPLNAIRYRREAAVAELDSEVGWRPYGDKHAESLFTRFYQHVILPERFGVDKRRAHLSSLIVNGEIGRAQALERLALPPCSEEERTNELAYVAKKLGFSTDELEDLLRQPPVPHDAFPSRARHFAAISSLRDRMRSRALRRS